MNYGAKLNPEHSLRKAKGVKGTRQKVIITHSRSDVGQNQLLLGRFLSLGNDDIIVQLSLTDPNRMLVNNVSRAIMKHLAVKFDRK